jgi:hypothetical protein
MIYFLVNNDYQLLDARIHAQGLRLQGQESTLIEVPHMLQESNRGDGFRQLFNFPAPLKSHGWMGAWWCYFGARRDVNRQLTPKAGDTLFLYTEYELLNHFIALRFKRAGARVFLLEDGGVGTYIPFSVPSQEKLTLKEHIVALMTRCLPGLHRTTFHKLNGIVFPWMEDRQIDGLCTYRPLRIIRQIPVHVLHGPVRARLETIPGRVLFLNERMYDDYQNATEYMHGLETIMRALVKGFGEVLFKFHPREKQPWRGRIAELLASHFPTVRIVEDSRAAELLLAELRPEALASYFSTALLSLTGTGIEPLFLFQLLPEVARQKVFVQCEGLLRQWNYHFVANWDEAHSGYTSCMGSDGGVPYTSLQNLLQSSHNGMQG